MIIRPNPEFQDLRGEILPEEAYLNRRALLAAAGFGTAALAGDAFAQAAPRAAAKAPAAAAAVPRPAQPAPGTPIPRRATVHRMTDPWTSEAAATGYNNFYEFGTSKSDPARLAGRMNVSNWTISVEGEAERTGTFALTQLVDFSRLEERVYRLRCVEGWSMVLPWAGVSMASVLAQFRPKPAARFVQFESRLNRAEMPGTAFPTLNWPYVEGLRMDEAMNELSFFAVGLYGRALRQQNGAPFRMVVPWKYGFKSAKSIVRIRFVSRMPRTSWSESAPDEYGFYSNVNPGVDHPRWSQASERVIDGSPFPKRRRTDMFNGYGSYVERLYAGMDLRANY